MNEAYRLIIPLEIETSSHEQITLHNNHMEKVMPCLLILLGQAKNVLILALTVTQVHTT